MADINRDKILSVFAVIRPQHWIKNCFVLAPLLFSGRYNDIGMCANVAVALLSFCVISSGVYVINDLRDRREDQRHPVKKFRPIAAGVLSVKYAVALSVVLILPGLGLSWLVNGRVMCVALLYAAINIVYSFGLKHVAILDVMTIAAGFVLRILAGSAAIAVVPSHWLVLCTIMISLFLGFTKRRVELAAVTESGSAPSSRIVLKDYSMAFLDQVIAVVTGATIICYALYTVDARTLQVFGTRAMLLTVPSVIYGVFRYLYIIYHLERGQDPTQTLTHDIPTIINLIIWVIISLLVVAYGSQIGQIISGNP